MKGIRGSDLAKPSFKANPYPFYARLRAEKPVCRISALWAHAWLLPLRRRRGLPQGRAVRQGHHRQDALAAGQIALETLFRRFPDLTLAQPAESLRWRKAMPLRGLEELPVTF